MLGCARPWMVLKISRRKAVGTSSRNTPDEVSTRMGTLFIIISKTRRAEDELARWQSGQESSTIANAINRDPESAFTPVELAPAGPGLLMKTM